MRAASAHELVARDSTFYWVGGRVGETGHCVGSWSSEVFALSEGDRVNTGIKGLDELIEGGLPRGFSFLLLGGPGTGKTTFGVQYLYKGATEHGENGIYVTFDEPPYSISSA